MNWPNCEGISEVIRSKEKKTSIIPSKQELTYQSDVFVD
ncbi:hypothetical protein BRADI_5g16935v3 [Brachypodium distachyon]|uniref:Uncharacterized protein n=1 Tax=Brachypodium distachyon TaxID=15368 RepID=A0A2K2CHR4_BRADI|nr:hypothetical protein BRADI_5g16935v3 [Brachypodium distachyon]